jgi:hypothetical protein
MASITHSLLVYSDGNVQVREQFYRKPHDLEIVRYNEPEDWRYGGDGYRSGPVRNAVLNDPRNPQQKPMPQVYRTFPDHVINLRCAAVRLIRDINHPQIADKQISTLLNSNFAFSNNTGFPERYNCLTGENAGEKDPALHSPILTGGAVLKPLEIVGDMLYYDYIDMNKHLPTASDVIARPWLWFWITAVTSTGQVNMVTRLGTDGLYYPVRMPIFSERPLYAPVSWFHKLPMGFWPASASWMATK